MLPTFGRLRKDREAPGACGSFRKLGVLYFGVL